MTELFEKYEAAMIVCKNCEMYYRCSHIGSLDCKCIEEKFTEVSENDD